MPSNKDIRQLYSLLVSKQVQLMKLAGEIDPSSKEFIKAKNTINMFMIDLTKQIINPDSKEEDVYSENRAAELLMMNGAFKKIHELTMQILSDFEDAKNLLK